MFEGIDQLEIPKEWHDHFEDNLFRLRGYRLKRLGHGKCEYPIYILTMPDYRVIVKMFYLNSIEIVITETATNHVLCNENLKIENSTKRSGAEILDGIRSIYSDCICYGWRRHKWDGLQRCEDTSLGRVLA